MPLRWIVLAGLCAVALLAARALPSYRAFAVSPPLLAVGPSTPEIGTRLGPPLRLTRGWHYLVQMQGEATAAFRVDFVYPDGARSAALTVYPWALGPGRQPFHAVIKPDRDAHGAALEFLPRDPDAPAGIRLTQLSVEHLDDAYYFWRATLAVLRVLAALGLATGILRFLWLAGQRWAARERSPTDEPDATAPPLTSIRQRGGLIFWAALLLLLNGSLMPFLIQNRCSRLFDKELYCPLISGWDDSFYFFWLRSVMVDGDVDFSNDLLYCDSLAQATREKLVRELPRTATGLIPNKYPIGWSLVGVPWYGVATLAAHAANLFGAHIPYDGWHPIYQITLILGQAVYAVAGLYFAGRFVAEYVPGAVGLCGVLLAWLGSVLLYYQTLGLSMSHNTMFFGVAGAYWFAARLRRHPASGWNWVLVGGFCALVILARYQGAVLLLFPGVVCLRLLAADFRATAPRFLAATVVGALPLGLQVLAWKRVFGSFFLYTYQGETFSWTRPHVLESFFSPFHGLFYWHPVMLAALAGFGLWAVRTTRRIDACCFAASLLLVLYVNAAWDCWWFGASFGARAFDGCVLFAMLGLAALLERLLRWRPAAFHAAAAVLLAGGLWNVNLVWLAALGWLPLEQPVRWAEIAAHSLSHTPWVR